MEDQLVKTVPVRRRWLALFLVMGLVAAACSPETTDATATTEPATTSTEDTADDTDDTDAPAPAEGFPFSIAIFSDPTTDNPWAAYDTETDFWTGYVNPDMASLYRYQGPTYTLIPFMAEPDTPPDVEADGDLWSVTVPIREGVTWSDGEQMDANDVVFTVETIQKYDGLGGNFRTSWPLATDPVEDDPATEDDETAPAENGIVSAEAIDDMTVKISFNFEPGLAIWPFSVGLGNVYPEHVWRAIVEESDTSEDLYAASGLGKANATAFVSAEREPGAFWRNEAIEDYYDKGAQYTVYSNGSVEYTSPGGTTEVYGGVPSGDEVASYTEGPFASEVVYSLYSDQNSAVLALTDGEVDFLLDEAGLLRGLQTLVLAEPSLNVIVNEQLRYRYLSFNTRKFPMSEISFRQAIACRIDKTFMADTVFGGAAIAMNSQVPPGNSFWANPDVEGTCEGQSEQERFETAKQILLDAGWTWDVEPMWNDDNREVLPQGEGLTGPDGTAIQPLELLAPGPSYDPLRATYSLFIEEWAVDLGIPVAANSTAFSVIVDRVLATGEGALEWDMYILGWEIPDPFPDHVFEFFKSSNDSAVGGYNTPGYSNPEFDALADEFARAKTLEEARDLVFQAEEMLAEDLPYVVLFTIPIIEAYRNTIEFPFTNTLGGVQSWPGLTSSVVSNR